MTPVKQIKPIWYYVFWGAATLCVVAGQLWIADSYRHLAAVLEANLT